MSDSRGVAKIWIIIISAFVGAILLVTAVSAWFYFGQRSEQQTTCNFNDKVFCRYINASKKITGNVTVVSNNPLTQTSSTTKIQDPTAYATAQTIDGKQRQVVIVNGQQYVNEGTNGWAQQKIGVVSPYNLAELLVPVSASPQLKLTNQGKVTCGSLQCYQYTTTAPAKAGSLVPQLYTISFDTKDYLPRQIVKQLPIGIQTEAFTYGSVTVSAPK